MFDGARLITALLVLVVLVLLFEAFDLTTTRSTSLDGSELRRQVAALHARLDALSNDRGPTTTVVPATGVTAAAARTSRLPTSSQRSGRHEAGIASDLGHTGRRLHFVFSADCRYPPKVHWQSVPLLYSFFQTQPYPAVITEVLSCHNTTWTPHWHLHFTPHEQARVRFHVAPSRNPHPTTGDEYAPYNKPSGLRDWVERTGGPHDNDVVVMVDWDMVLMRAFPADVLAGIGDRRAHAAHCGIGTAWASNASAQNICPDWCPKKTAAEVAAVGGAGAPHAWTARDFAEVLPLWQDYTERIRANPAARDAGGWMAEMYGYLLGAMQLGIQHTIHPDWMLSSSHPYEWNDAIVPPLTLHYCQQYHVGEWHFYKYDISAHDALSCDFPLLEEPPAEVGDKTDVAHANTKDIWIAHSLVMQINSGFTWYKRRACGVNWSSGKRFRARPDDIGEMAGAPGGTWMLRGP